MTDAVECEKAGETPTFPGRHSQHTVPGLPGGGTTACWE